MDIQKLSKENFYQTVANNEIVVVDFWADWCVPCHSFTPIYRAVAAKHPAILFAEVDIEAQPELAAELTVRSIPTVMIFRKNIMVFCESGLLPASALEDLLVQVNALNMDDVHKQLGIEDKQ